VSEHYNLQRADLLDVLETFKREAAGAQVALVYYAGHGMEIEGKNVLAPTDMEVDCKDKTALRSVDLDQLFGAASPAPHQIVLESSAFHFSPPAPSDTRNFVYFRHDRACCFRLTSRYLWSASGP
jgi:uncharacterized caspase-like protein